MGCDLVITCGIPQYPIDILFNRAQVDHFRVTGIAISAGALRGKILGYHNSAVAFDQLGLIGCGDLIVKIILQG